MASSIGSVNFFSLPYGVANPPGKRIEDITRSGTNGVGLRDLGTSGEMFTKLGVQHHANAAAVKTHIVACRALIGDGVKTMTDNQGNQWTRIAVLAVRPRSVQPIIATGYEYRTEIEFDLRDTNES